MTNQPIETRMMDEVPGRPKPLRWRIVIALLLAAFLPLALSGFGSWVVFGRLMEKKSAEIVRTAVRSHAHAIESNLSENLRLLQFAAESNPLDDMRRPERLKALFDVLNASSGGRFVDLGVIDDQGDHLAYAGPYDLHGKNYREAEWFKELAGSQAFISDVFLGFRRVPHCVIAVKRSEAGRLWILRATINSDYFDRLVRTVQLSEGSSAYIVNREGLYQTTPASGAVLDAGPVREPAYFSGDREQRIREGGKRLIRVSTWINNNRWLLVVDQDLSVVRAPVNQAIAAGASVVAVAVLLLVLTTFFATWHLTRRIEKANEERDEMSQAFLRSARLASIGELSTGLAHEINNPLAIINAEQTNISDLLRDFEGDEKSRREIVESIERCKSQVQRCARITRKMLQFGRQKETNLEPIDAGPRVLDIAGFLQRRAAIRNIRIVTSIEENLPLAYIDPVELEQVLVNLMNNAFDAMPDGGSVTLNVFEKSGAIHLQVSDTGAGIAAKDLPHIFEPFFTTKEAGQGTGLGLSVCYGIVQSWGGTIEAESEPGKGTTILILLPLRPKDSRDPGA